MYGLFLYTYDYYEWEYLICVSENKKDLMNHYKRLDNPYKVFAEDDLEHRDFRIQDRKHYMIKEVKVI